MFSGVDFEDVRGLAFQAPKTLVEMAYGGMTGGYTFAAQSVKQSFDDLKETGAGDKLSDVQKVGYVFVQAAVMAGLNKFSIDKILKNTGLAKSIQNKIAKEVVEEQVEKGIKATAKDIEREVFKKVSTLSTKLKSAGIKEQKLPLQKELQRG